MNQIKFRELHRTARLGNLGTLSFSAGSLYDWFLTQVYDLRFPHIGDDKHFGWPRCFDSLRHSTATRLKWKRQKAYVSHIKFCSRCKCEHHEYHDCPDWR
jgi:hypothetical protein